MSTEQTTSPLSGDDQVIAETWTKVYGHRQNQGQATADQMSVPEAFQPRRRARIGRVAGFIKNLRLPRAKAKHEAKHMRTARNAEFQSLLRSDAMFLEEHTESQSSIETTTPKPNQYSGLFRKTTRVGLAMGALTLLSFGLNNHVQYRPDSTTQTSRAHTSQSFGTNDTTAAANHAISVETATPAIAIAEQGNDRTILSFTINQDTPTIWQGVEQQLEASSGTPASPQQIAENVDRIGQFYDADPSVVYAGDRVIFEPTAA
ncbi:MAG: hypothetical protein U0520_00260 [Candidatus Saccharimonadales bacterium]